MELMRISTSEGTAKVLVNESDCTNTGEYSLHIIGKQLRNLAQQFRDTKDVKYMEQGLTLKDVAVRMFKRIKSYLSYL